MSSIRDLFWGKTERDRERERVCRLCQLKCYCTRKTCNSQYAPTVYPSQFSVARHGKNGDLACFQSSSAGPWYGVLNPSSKIPSLIISSPRSCQKPQLGKTCHGTTCLLSPSEQNAAIFPGVKKTGGLHWGAFASSTQDVVFRETGTDTVPNASPTAASASSDIYGAPTWELLGVIGH